MSHYSLAFQPTALDKWSRSTARKLKAFYKKHPDRYPAFFYRGMSGVVTATALMLALNRGKPFYYCMYYVRKDAEHTDSHGKAIETSIFEDPSDTHKQKRDWIFVDDFISTGNTLVQSVEKLLANGYSIDGESIYTILTGDIDPDDDDSLLYSSFMDTLDHFDSEEDYPFVKNISEQIAKLIK